MLRSVARIVTAHKQREGGGFIVRRPVGGEVDYVDPFLMLDHMGPADYAPGEAVGAPDHPHRGFETVTYMLSGEFHHQDSVGNSGTLKSGWAQWMTAGRGVIHSEMPSDDFQKTGGRMEGFQLWVNLPAKDKMVEPRYQDTPPESIPVATDQDGRVNVKVIAGESLNTAAVIQTRTPMMFLDVVARDGGELRQKVDAGFNGFVYVYRGEGSFGKDGVKAKEGQILVMKQNGDTFSIQAPADGEVRALLLAGEPINEPIARHGPFVMNTQQEIMQCFRDYQSGTFAKPIPGSEERMAKTREARRAMDKSGRHEL